MKKNKKLLTALLIAAFSSIFFLGSNVANAMAEVAITVKNPDPYTGNQSWFVHENEAGETIEDIATVKNFGHETAIVNVYAVDAATSKSGTFILKLRDQEQENIGIWTEVQEQKLTIPPGERIDVPFMIQIPDDVNPGQYFGGIVVESTSNQNQHSNADCGENQICGTSVAVQTRVGARIYLTVPGDMKEEIAWTQFQQMKGLTGRTYFKFKIENNGSISYEPRAHIKIYDVIGNVYDEFDAPLGISLPSTTIEPTIAWSKKTPFIGKFTAEATVDFPRRFYTKAPQLHGAAIEPMSFTFWVLPWGMITIVILLVLGAGGSYSVHNLRIRRIASNSEKYHVNINESIISIAKRRGIKWKLLAKINKLKPPYVIKKGDIILVPKKNEETT